MTCGELVVIAGTNEVGIIIEPPGEGTFTERLKNNELGHIACFCKMPDHLVKIYWEERSQNESTDNHN